MQYFIKIGLTALMVVMVSEIAKRSSFWSAFFASLPLMSVLAFVWVYLESGNAHAVGQLSYAIFWLVIPSLLFFLVLPFLLNQGINFWTSLLLSTTVTALGYFGMVQILKAFKINIG